MIESNKFDKIQYKNQISQFNLNFIISRMIATKLLQASKKQIQPKPERVKIKHKSYRQLLGLDRPKKKIQIESDNENDDFLQKLLKQQAKEKKKKKNGSKRGQSKSRQQKQRKNMKVTQSQQLRRQQKGGKQKPQVKIEISKQFKEESKEKSRKVINISKDGKIDQSKAKTQKQLNLQSDIKIDEENSVPFMVTNNLFVTVKNNRSAQCLKLLHENFHKTSMPQFNEYQVHHDLNPQKHAILHRFSQTSGFSGFKATNLTTAELIAMSQIRIHGKPQKRLYRRQRLFKNEQQQSRFVQSLQTVKQKKYSMPSLL